MTRTYLWIGIAGTLTLAGLAGAYWFASDPRPTDARAAATSAPSGERKVLYWYDPMSPNQRFDAPGKSPFMDMELLPKYADEGGNESTVQIDPSLTQNLGVRLAAVERGRLALSIEAPATVKFNERDVAVLQARSAGFVERAYAKAPGDLVKKGAPIADLLISDWAGAQIEFIALLKTSDKNLAAAARERLVLLGMPKELIREVERAREPRLIVTVRAPADGVLTAIGVREGMSVMAGQMLAEINGFTPVWLEAQVPEADAQSLRRGQEAQAEFPAFPGKTLRGRVTLVLPEANADARTARVRIELPNPDGSLRPGLYARVRIAVSDGPERQLVPSEAVIRTGQRSIVMVAEDGGRYRPVEVTLGREADGRIEIVNGLTPGQQVVASGQFLIDSEASIRGVLARASAGTAEPAPMAVHEGEGTIESLSADEVTLSHGPIHSLKWPAMTMPFRVESTGVADGLQVGDRVRFAFRQDDDGYTVEKFSRQGARR